MADTTARISPRPYQQDAADAALRELRSTDSTLIVAATGVGKTPIAGIVAREWERIDPGRRVLVLVNRVELLKQFRDTFRAMLSEDVVEVEAAGAYAMHERGSLFPNQVGRVVIASKDSLFEWPRLRRWRPDEVGLIIPDEAHHVTPRNKTYVRILDYFKGYKTLGLTATPDRMDGVALRSYFATVAYRYEAYDAIKDSWLVPIRQQVETVAGWDLSRCGRSSTGDYELSALDEAMREERPTQALATAAIRYGNEGGVPRPVLVFTVSVDHAELCADAINRRQPGSAVALCGEDHPEVRRVQLERYRSGEVQYLVGCTLFTEGFDEPRVSVVIVGRPTMSRALYAQMVGRGMRPWPDCVPALNLAPDGTARAEVIRRSRKPSVLVVDFVGNADVHKLRPLNSADILGGWYPQKVRDEAAEIMREPRGTPWDPEKAIREARKRLDEKERGRRRRLIMDARLESREVDPFAWCDVRPPRKNALRRGRKPTPRMREYLMRHEVPGVDKLNFDQAKYLIGELQRKKAAEPPSPRQAAILNRYGFPADRMTWQEARQAIDLIADGGWRVPGAT